MIIEQGKEARRLAIRLHTKAYVRSFRLAQSRVWSRSRNGPSEEFEGINFDIKYKPVANRLADDCLTLDTDFTFTMLEESQESASTPLLFIECRFEAQYAFYGDYRPLEEEIEAFHAANAIFNCWPFFREYVQNAVVRMDFPAPPVPFLRIVSKADDQPSTPQKLPALEHKTGTKTLGRPKGHAE